MKKIRKSRFTLIEILAVIALLSVLISIFVPAFNRMMFGSKVDQMASNFKTGMEVAQAKAVASGKYVAMILPTKYSEADSKIKPYCNGGYRLAFVKKDGDNWNFVNWVPGSNWTNIADGAMFVRCELRKNWLDDNKKFKDLPSSSLNTSLSSVVSGHSHLEEIQANGSKDSDAKGLKNISDPNATAENCDNLRGIIFSPLCGFSDSDTPMLLFFTEARIEANSYKYDNPDNFVVLKLNPITGKVSYLPMEDGE